MDENITENKPDESCVPDELQRAVGLWLSARYRLDQLIQHIARLHRAQQAHPITRHGKLSVVWRKELSELFDYANQVAASLQAEAQEASKHLHSGTSSPQALPPEGMLIEAGNREPVPIPEAKEQPWPRDNAS